MLIKILKYLMTILLLLLGMVVIYGKKLDVSDAPQKADLIVCLGGGFIERYEKTIELYKEKYAKYVVVTGSGIGLGYPHDKLGFWKIPYLGEHGIPTKNIVRLQHTENTYQEMREIKKYMRAKQYKSVLIVSDPPHTKRIKYTIAQMDYAKEGLSVRVVGSDVVWWNKSHFCLTAKALWEAAKEMMGVGYYFIRY